jgi:hypothetical protein
MRSSLLFVALALASGGCSAIVQPDPSRLGGRDAGPGGTTDTGPGLVDAYSPMGCSGGCDDGVPCTRDSCVSGRCEHAPDDLMCAPMQRCTPTGCVATTCSTPADCDDGNPCTVDQCSAGMCRILPRDADMDGHGDAMCGGDDCNDGNSRVAPGLPELCGNGLDDDCNPATSDVCAALPDDCGTATPVDLSSGHAVVAGSFAALAADYASFCVDEGRRTARDAIYRLDLGTRLTDLRIETVGSVDTVLSVSNECGNFTAPACNDDAQPGADQNARVWVHPAAGTIYVAVSAFQAEEMGDYEAHFTASPVASAECGGGTLNVTDGGTVIGVALPPDRASGSCMDGARGLESTAHFDGSDINRVRLYAGFDAYLYVRSGCDATTEELCEVGT